MEFALVFGVNYYYSVDAVPKFVQHRMNFLTTRYGNNLDAQAPVWAKHNAARLMTRYGALNI